MAIETVKLFREIDLDVDMNAPATLTFSTELPQYNLTVRFEKVFTPSVAGRRPFRIVLPGDTKGSLYRIRIAPTGDMRLYRVRVLLRPLPGQWQWVDVPLRPTPAEWSPVRLPIRATPAEWSKIALPVRATPEGFSGAKLPIRPTSEGFGAAKLRIRETQEGFAAVKLPIRPTPEGYGDARLPITPTPLEPQWVGVPTDAVE